MASVDMTTKIGGRVVQPALPVVDASPATPLEKSFNESLQAEFISKHIPLEPTEGIQRRERVLNRMGALVREWIRFVCTQRGLPADVIENAGGQLFTSGSYRLGVHEPGADIDTILVAPNMCSRQDFFGNNMVDVEEENDPSAPRIRDPNSLAERIRNHPDVTNFVPVEGAAVPILTFDWEGVNIDLLFARLNTASVPPSLDIDQDTVLDGVDSATEKSLNGPRVTNLIAALVSGTPERYQTFLEVVRCVRKWAKARGLYSNKMGYWGGVNINIAVALCVQLYPRTTPASLLRKFFLVFRTWRWPNPVLLTKPHDAGFGLPVWNSTTSGTARHVAPIITPAYPAMNSTLSVSRQTLQIMHEEFCRGHEILDRLWKEHQTRELERQRTGKVYDTPLDWAELFRPSDFFIAYPHYLSLCIVGPTQEDAQAWAGFVESRLRKLVSDLLGRSLPLSKIQLWPKKIEACIADQSALLTLSQRKNSITYMVGFQVDKLRMRGDQLNVEMQMARFREWELSRFQPLMPGMDILVKSFDCKSLPRICFVDMGGKESAMKRRRALRDADPKLQERKRQRELAKLKARMAKMQERKMKKEQEELNEGQAVGGEEQAGEGERKRKRSDSAADDEVGRAETTGDNLVGGVSVKVEASETDLLESALDNIQDGEVKTREQAEADRRKLLSGELLVGNDEDGEPSDDEDLGAYTADDARHSVYVKQVKQDEVEDQTATEMVVSAVADVGRDIRALPMAEDEADILRKAGFALYEDVTGDARVIGGNMPTPFRSSVPINILSQPVGDIKIKFRSKFDIIKLDANGHIIDTGDEDFTPSKTWQGRKAGFEFKLGERGQGYYRTGKKVVIPSNMAY